MGAVGGGWGRFGGCKGGVGGCEGGVGGGLAYPDAPRPPPPPPPPPPPRGLAYRDARRAQSSRVAVEEARAEAVHRVGEERRCECPPHATASMHSKRAERVVDAARVERHLGGVRGGGGMGGFSIWES